MKNIANALQKAEKIAIFVHISADGDALGSAFALKYNLNKMNKIADVYLNETVSERLEFMLKIASSEYKTDLDCDDYDCLIALDCGDAGRLGKYKEYFESHTNTLNVDHHFTNNGYAGLNFVSGSSSATGELVFDLLAELGTEVDSITASLLYVAISSDTGCFAYSNVTTKTHQIAAELSEYEFDRAEINRLLFATNTLLELKLQAYIIENMLICHNGKLAVAVIDEECLKNYGASYEHTEGLIDTLRCVKGVEIACLIKQKDGKTKGSVRTNAYADATVIASNFGGGGHIRAAGFSCDSSLEEVKNKVIEITKDM